MPTLNISPVIAAITFYTRIPVPQSWHQRVTKDALAASGPFLPLVGLGVGACSAAVYMISVNHLGDHLAALLALASGAWITGAFHEDGLADMADGFGGGWTRDDILRIMKDPTHGTYGFLTLLLATLLKVAALIRMGPDFVPFALIAAHTMGRSLAVTFLTTHDYVRTEGKAQNATRRQSLVALLISLACGVASLTPLGGIKLAWILGALILMRTYFSRLFVRKLGGYTGDCLGAVEQCAEVVILLIVAWS
jgi:adenosylcobinamide-GDP ribazoletransferase